ncbi:MAG: aminotransferase class III-fold pyridoxal phosphate-dependent enzyme, partial [Armatimonadota bacterium]
MDGQAFRDQVIDQYSAHVNAPLARLKAFAGFGAETRSEGCYLYDQDGKAYLDFLGGYGVFSLGHRHPKVVEAVKAQLDVMPLSSKVFLNPKEAELATALAEVAPEGLEYTFFSNSGAEAVEASLKFARVATGRTEFVSTIGSYHGKTMGGLSVTGRDKFRFPFEPLIPGVSFVPYGDVTALNAISTTTAAFIVEPVQGEGGIFIPPDGYLKAAREACDQAGALLIVDEVQTGLGRTGYMFGSEHDGVRPDLMPLAKCLGGGVMPIGATMGTKAVWDKVYGINPLLHTSTFGGNPLAMAAGIAALKVIK